MENILTFRNVQDAINHILDANMYDIDLIEFENKLANYSAFRHKDTIFLIDEQGLLD